ncbi:hypothetical protein BB560_000293 [Smittium megazygosporum]|uniref:Uncharacterized protein n=1 Tax=Smittium megazygosporum TaxID=133381 RepID=A0A2T9ZKS9_9FUNG|nr:hypothetical protein BB560_000293 [Smittium megazygosporum]
MEILDALDEIRTRNTLEERVGVDKAIETISENQTKLELDRLKAEEEEIDKLAKAIFKDADGEKVKRLLPEDSVVNTSSKKVSLTKDTTFSVKPAKNSAKQNTKNSVLSTFGVVIIKPASNQGKNNISKQASSSSSSSSDNKKPEQTVLENMFDGYSSDST